MRRAAQIFVPAIAAWGLLRPHIPTWWIEGHVSAQAPPVPAYVKTNLENNDQKIRLSPSIPIDLIQNWIPLPPPDGPKKVGRVISVATLPI